MSRVLLAILCAAMVAWATMPAFAQAGPARPDAARQTSTDQRGPDITAALQAMPPSARAFIDPRATELAANGEGVQLDSPRGLNPMEVMSQAGDLMSRVGGGEPAGERGGLTVALNIMVLLTVITLVPSVILMCTCFVRILIVMSLLRQAIGTQSIPPPQVVTGLAIFMTAAVMVPTAERVWNDAIVPWRAGEVQNYDELWTRAKQPIRDYMFDQIEATGNWSSVYAMLNYRGVDTSDPGALTRADVDMTALVPAYMLSELKVGFVMGFRLYLPFLVIDMVIAIVLISMGMMMLPPTLISLPFKLLLFVLVDGWTLVVGSLLESFVREGDMQRLSADPTMAMLPICVVLLFSRVRRDPNRSLPRVKRAIRPEEAADGSR